MLPFTRRISKFHVFSYFLINIRLAKYFNMMDEEPVCKIFYPVEAQVIIIGLRENKMHIDMILPDFIDGTEPHFSKQSNSGFHRMKLEVADLPVFGKEMVKKIYYFLRLSLKETFNSICAAGMRLVLVVKLVLALGTGPHICLQSFLFNYTSMVRLRSP
jgi:hypothetical protein